MYEGGGGPGAATVQIEGFCQRGKEERAWSCAHIPPEQYVPSPEPPCLRLG